MKRTLLTLLSLTILILMGGWTFSRWNDSDPMTAKNFQAGTVIVLFGFVASLEMIWKPKQY